MELKSTSLVFDVNNVASEIFQRIGSSPVFPSFSMYLPVEVLLSLLSDNNKRDLTNKVHSIQLPLKAKLTSWKSRARRWSFTFTRTGNSMTPNAPEICLKKLNHKFALWSFINLI